MTASQTDGKIPFCHLHLHTEYSLLDSTCKVNRLMERARELGMDQIAITDHGVLYGAIDFYKQALKHGLKPIIGCEVYLARNGIEERTSQANNMHLVLLAETQKGYQNLCRLVSLAHLEGFYYKARIDKTLLQKYHKGLIGLSACLKGEISEACKTGKTERGIELAREYSQILGKNNFFLEIQDHGIPEQQTTNKAIIEIARELDLPLVATNDVHYIKRKHAEAHDALICLQQQSLLSDENRMKYQGDQFYLKSGAEMLELFPEHPEAISNTVDIGHRCNVTFEFDLPAHKLHFPTYPIPKDVKTHEEHFISLCKEGLREKYALQNLDHPETQKEKEIHERFYHEFGVIKKTGFLNYFLVVQDFVRYAKEHNIPVGPGRGSGASSLLAYLLGITSVDPLHYGLVFERFLNPDRISPPDFDIDFCQYRRDRVIQYVRDKYGDENVAQIVTFGTLGAKTIIRDVGRILNIPLGDCDKLAKKVPESPKITLEEAREQNPEFDKACKTDPQAQRIMKYAPILEGLPRHIGTHAAGVVIGEKPLVDILPLTSDKDDQVITQFEKGPMEEIGLLKMDFLGLKTLSVIREAVDNIAQNHALKIDIEEIPLDDQKTFELLNRADTIGIFQVESPGMRDTLKQFNLDCIEDLIAILALYRPGPMQFIPDFIKRKHGEVEVSYDHPLLEPILKETHGIIVYQEQIQQAAKVLAGFSLGQGDILRRAMGKKKPEEMALQRDRFIEGCKKTNAIDKKLAAKIFDNIEKFAQYGFNKSHSTAYGIISYQTAYLKAHYPVEFMAALLSSEMGNTDKLPYLIAEANQMGIDVLPPDVNKSIVRFRPTEKGILFGMAAIKNVGEGVVSEIVRVREKTGQFKGLIDFCIQLGENQQSETPQNINRTALESLVSCGAFDFTNLARSRLYAGISAALNRAIEKQRDALAGQTSMFAALSGAQTEENTDEDLPQKKPWSESKMLSLEKELIGFYISGHPLTKFEWILEKFTTHRIVKLAELELQSSLRCGGQATEINRIYTRKKKRPMATFRVEGLDGHINAIVFPDAFEECGHLLEEERPLIYCGTLSEDRQSQIQLQIEEIYPLEQAPELFTKKIHLHLPEAKTSEKEFLALKKILAKYPGKIPFHICLLHSSGTKIFIKTNPRFEVGISQKLCLDMEHLIGEESVYVQVKDQLFLKPRRQKRKRRNPRGRNGS